MNDVKDGYAAVTNYDVELHEWLSQATCFYKFKNLITQEVEKLRLGDWSYSRLDLPDRLCINELIGVIDPVLVADYLAEDFYRCDLMLECTRYSTKPIFKSQLENMVVNAPCTNPQYEQYKKLLILHKKLGYHDTYCVPIKSCFNDGVVLFSATSIGIGARAFKKIINKNAEKMRMIGQVVDNIGVMKFPEHFIDPKKKYDELTSSTSYQFFSTLIKNDLSREECAKHYGISMSDANKRLASIHQLFGVKNNISAYKKMREAGYID